MTSFSRSLAALAILMAVAGCSNSNTSLSGGGNENGGSAAGRIGSMFRF